MSPETIGLRQVFDVIAFCTLMLLVGMAMLDCTLHKILTAVKELAVKPTETVESAPVAKGKESQ